METPSEIIGKPKKNKLSMANENQIFTSRRMSSTQLWKQLKIEMLDKIPEV